MLWRLVLALIGAVTLGGVLAERAYADEPLDALETIAAETGEAVEAPKEPTAIEAPTEPAVTATEPIVAAAAQTSQAADAVGTVSAPLAAPVAAVGQAVEPAAAGAAPITGPLHSTADPILDTAARITDPVVGTVDPLTGPVGEALGPVNAPVAEVLDPISRPLSAPPIDPVRDLVGPVEPATAARTTGTTAASAIDASTATGTAPASTAASAATTVAVEGPAPVAPDLTVPAGDHAAILPAAGPIPAVSTALASLELASSPLVAAGILSLFAFACLTGSARLRDFVTPAFPSRTLAPAVPPG